MGQSTRGTSASIHVVNWQVSRCRHRRGLLSYRGTRVPHSGNGNGPAPVSTRTATCCPLTSRSTLTTVQGAGSPRMARYSSMSRIAPILLAGMDRSIARVAAYSTDIQKNAGLTAPEPTGTQ